MEEISVKGKKYLKAKLVARELGYTSDYIGQLCRAGKVDAELVGRTWYVDPNTVKGHKANRYRSTKAASKKQIKSDILQAVQDQQMQQTEHFYSHQGVKDQPRVSYEKDESELIPVTSKQSHKEASVELPVELADAKKVSIGNKTDRKYHFEAPKRKETKFFGTLEVTDFMTEVPVSGDDSAPKKVKVNGLDKPKKEAHQSQAVEQVVKIKQKKPLAPKPKPVTPAKVSPAKSIPVEGGESVEPLPIFYKIAPPAAFMLAAIATIGLLGLEVTTTATGTTVSTGYTFAADNLFALIYLVK